VQRVPAAEFARAWRGLDGESRLAFLAAVWRARGFTARVVDGEVLADRQGTDGTRRARIRPVPDGRRGLLGTLGRPVTGGTPVVAVAADPASGSEPADRTDGGATARPRSDGAPVDGAERRLDAADLRDLLLYGLDRPDGERLARDHLDLSLTVPDDGGVDEPAADEWDRRPGLVATLVVAVVIGAALAGGGGGFGFGAWVDGVAGGDDGVGTQPDGGTDGGDESLTEADGSGGGGAGSSRDGDPAAGTPGALNPPGTPPPAGPVTGGGTDGEGPPDPATYGRSAGYPPGIGAGGVANLTALTAANEAALANGSFRLQVTAEGYAPATLVSGAPVRGPAGDYRGDGRWGNVSASVEVTNGTRAVERVTGQWFAAPDNEPIPIEYVGYAARGREWRQTTVVYAGGEDRVTETGVERVSAVRTPAESVAGMMAGWLRPYRSGLAAANVTRAADGSVRVTLTRTDRTTTVPRVYGVFLRVAPDGRLERGSVTVVREPGPDSGRTTLTFTLVDGSSVTAPSVLPHLPPRRPTDSGGPSRPAGANATPEAASAAR
jgi:hypothetical protein